MLDRDDFIKGLRAAAEFLESNPEFPTPISAIHISISINNKPDLQKAASMMSTFDKVGGPYYYTLRKKFGDGVRLDTYTDREKVCKRVVTGQRLIPAMPAAEERVEDIVKWECPEFLVVAGKELEQDS